MPGTFTYDEATNKIVVTNGTEGAPATFNDMYTADQAGTDTILLDAGTPASDLALDYAVRPTHSKALKVKCVVANKSAEADYIFITGTDWKGAAQTEAIDVTAGDGSYETTKYWASITTLDCSDNAAGGGAVWDDGDLTVTQDIWGVVWEHTAEISYEIDAVVTYGDTSTATYFAAEGLSVTFNKAISITANAVARFGKWLESGSSINIADNSSHGCFVKFAEVYGSTTNYINYGHLLIYGSVFNAAKDGTTQRIYLYASAGGSSYVDMRQSVFTGFRGLYFLSVNDYVDTVISQDTLAGFYISVGVTSDWCGVVASGMSSNLAGGRAVVTNLNISYTIHIYGADNVFTLQNPVSVPAVKEIVEANSSIIEQYTCNIHVADEDGADLSGVTIQCQTFGNVVSPDAGSTFYKCVENHTSGVFADDLAADKWELTTAAYAALAGCDGGAGTGAWVTGIDYVAATSEFSTATDVNGDIAEQTIDYKKWVGTSEALLTFGPFTFTYTHADYPDFVMNEITVDHPIVWRIEMGISTANLGDAVLDEVVEGAITLREAIRLNLAVLTGKSSGGGTSTVVFRDTGDSKNRISATVDANGNRTAVGTRDGS